MSPFDPFAKLEELFEGEIGERNRLINFLISPKRKELIVAIELDDDILLDEEGLKIKEEFNDIIGRSLRQAEIEDQAVAAVESLADLAKRLDDDEGIL